MKIKSISCTQFAGINNRDISFSDGLNVVYGKNESGKSTLVNLLSRTLFQDAKLDGRKDKDFKDLYFPSQIKGQKVAGDFVDGKITLEAEDGIYTLSKEWGDEPRCILTTPSGSYRDQNTIRDILERLLQYGEGVYSDMLFSSQRNTDASLQTILDASKKTDAKQEVVDAVSKAFVESDGVSIDAIEQHIDEKIEELAGKHWDIDRSAPMRKSGQWNRDVGEVLDKYYKLEKAQISFEEIAKLESELDKAAKACAEAEADVRSAETAYDAFSKYSRKLAVRKERAQIIESAEADIKKMMEDLSDWTECAKKLKIALPLRAEKLNRETEDKYNEAKRLHDEIARKEKSISGKSCPDGGEILQAEKAEREIPRLENKLRGMNICAAIHMINGNNIEIISLRTGKPLDLSGNIVSINEAVKVRIPGVMEMQLSPADIDVESVKKQISIREKILTDIFEKYDVSSVDGLKRLNNEITAAKNDIDLAGKKLNILLSGAGYDDIKALTENIVDAPRAKDDIDRDIASLCKDGDIEKYITVKETRINSYKSEYTNADGLKNMISSEEKELAAMKKSFEELEDIPSEYLGIGSPEEHLKALQDKKKDTQSVYEKSLVDKTNCAANLENYKDSLQSDPAEEVEKAEQEFNEAKNLLNHWLHIKKVFNGLKENLKNNPMQDIAKSFAHYLSVISDGRVSTELPDADKLNIEIFSEDKLLNYEKLSEGTKETVSLAFRLSVLDHLFPDGGVIVFDDPFTDMDDDRTRQSCELIKECAARHQVIFLTCKAECAEMLGSYVIKI